MTLSQEQACPGIGSGLAAVEPSNHRLPAAVSDEFLRDALEPTTLLRFRAEHEIRVQYPTILRAGPSQAGARGPRLLHEGRQLRRQAAPNRIVGIKWEFVSHDTNLISPPLTGEDAK